MYPYGTKRIRDPVPVERTKYPSLLRLNSIGEIASDPYTSDNIGLCGHQTPTSMGMSTLAHRNNLTGRQSLCSGNSVNLIDRVVSDNFRMAATPFKTESMNLNMEKPSFQCWKSCNWANPSYQVPGLHDTLQSQIKAQQFTFHPFVKADPIFVCPNTMTKNTSAPSQSDTKRFRPCASTNAYRNLPKCKKRNRYNRYDWQPKTQKTSQNAHVSQAASSVPQEKTKKDNVDSCYADDKSPDKTKSEPEVPKPKQKSKSASPLPQCDLTSQMSQLSLGEKVALGNAKTLKEPEECAVDWFSLNRQNSEKVFAVGVIAEFDDESDENLCNTPGINDEILDLFGLNDIDCKQSAENKSRIKKDTTSKQNVPNYNLQNDELRTACDANMEKEEKLREENSASDDCGKTQKNVDEKPEPVINIHHVLYTRNNKKSKSSRKKRRNANKKITANCSMNIKYAGNDLEKKRKFDALCGDHSQSGSISREFNVHSFLIAVSDSDSEGTCESDSDWSEDDDDGDFHMDIANTEFSCPLNLNLICSLTKSEIPQSSTTSEELDKVNSAWRINITLNSSPRKQKQCDKKVGVFH